MFKITITSGLRMDWSRIRVDARRPYRKAVTGAEERETMKTWIKVMVVGRFNLH